MSDLRSKLYSYWTHLNALQKGIVLTASTAVIWWVTGFWWPLLFFHIGLLLASFGARKLIDFNRNLDILKCITEFYARIRNPVTKSIQYISQRHRSEDDKSSESLHPHSQNPHFIESTPEVELNECLYFMRRDFLKSWYSYVSDEETFEEEAEELIDQLTMRAMEYVKNVDVIDHLPEYILLIRQHVLDYQEAMNKLNTQPKVRYKRDRTKEFKKLRNVDDAFARLGKFHIAAKNSGDLELIYLRSLMDVIMKVLLPKRAFKCYVAKELLLEILTSMVLQTVIEMFCDTDFLHKIMVLILSDDPLADMSAKEESAESSQVDHTLKEQTNISTGVPETFQQEPKSKEDLPISHVSKVLDGNDQNTDVISSPNLDCNRGSQTDPNTTQISSDECGHLEGQKDVFRPEYLATNVISLTDESADVFKDSKSQIPSASEQITFVNTEDLAKHFRVLGRSETDKLVSQNGEKIAHSDCSNLAVETESAPLSVNVEKTQSEREFSASPNGSLEGIEIENMPPDITFRPSFFLGSGDDLSLDSRSDYTSDECVASHDGSPSSINELANRDHVGIADFPDANSQPNGSEELIAHPAINKNLGNYIEPLRKAASCETLSNQQSRPHMLPISSSVTNLMNVGHREDGHCPDQSQNKNVAVVPPGLKRINTTAFPEPFVTGPVEGSSLEMPAFIYQDVHITSTEQTLDPARSVYTLYVIKYRAWHLEDEMWVLRKSIAKRRYREFVTLHDRLEEHPIYKKKIKGVKGPHRWKILSIGQLENHGIETRRKFLENYLQALIHRDQVGNSLAMREFLAYEEDAHIAFVKKAHVPRIDKMIAKTVSGVLDKITRTNKPSVRESRSRSYNSFRGVRSSDEVDSLNLIDDHSYNLEFGFQHSDQSEVHTMENVLTQHIHEQECLYSIDVTNNKDSQDSSGTASEDEFKDPIEDNHRDYKSDTSSQDSLPNARILNKSIPVASTVLDLAVTLVQDRNSWIVRKKVMSTLKILAGKSLERFLRENITELLTPERWCHYIRLFSALIWPCGQLDTKETPPLTKEEQAIRKEQARKCLWEFFPGFLPYVVGHEDFDFAVDKVMEIIEHKDLNRHLVFILLDKAVETLFPEVKTSEIQSELRLLNLQKSVQL